MTLTYVNEFLYMEPDAWQNEYLCIILMGKGGNGYIANENVPFPAGGGSGGSVWVQLRCKNIDYIQIYPSTEDDVPSSVLCKDTDGYKNKYCAYKGGNSTGNQAGGGGIAKIENDDRYSGTVASYLYNGAAGGTVSMGGSKNGYTASGSGINVDGTNIYAPRVSSTYTFHDSYTIVSYGAGNNGIAENGGGGAGVPANYENAESYAAGAPALAAYYYSNSL